MKVLYIWILILFPFFTNAASFDCASASTKVEHIICDNHPVSSLDEQLSKDYKNALNRIDNPEDLIAEQKIWLAQIRDRCQDMLCVYRAISDRSTVLAVSKKTYVSKYTNIEADGGLERNSQMNETIQTVDSVENSPPQEVISMDGSAQNISTSDGTNQTQNIEIDRTPEENVPMSYGYQQQNVQSQNASDLNITNSEHESKSGWFSGLIADIKDILFTVCALTMIWVFISGAMNNWVIYYDKKDVGVSLLSIVLVLLAMYLFSSKYFETSFLNFLCNWIVAPIVALFAIGLIHMSFQSAIKHNGNLYVGLLVGAFKILFTAFTTISMVLQFDRLSNAKTKKEALDAAFLLLILGWMARTMINGKRVYLKHGRDLPAQV